MSEAARADLYNGFSDLPGPERAETLMTHLPRYDAVEAATKSEVAVLRADIGVLESRLVSRLDRVETRLDGLGSRLDRLFLTLVAGFFRSWPRWPVLSSQPSDVDQTERLEGRMDAVS